MSESKDLSVGHASGDPSPRSPFARACSRRALLRRPNLRPSRKRPRRRTGSLRLDSPWPPRRRSPSWSPSRGRWSGRIASKPSILAERASETESLAQTVRSLRVRLDAIDAAKSRDDLADLRRSVGDMKTSVVSAREFNSALAQLSQRVDKLDNDESAKVSKLSERMDHEGSTLTAELSGRVDKLEKKIVAPISPPPQVAQAGAAAGPAQAHRQRFDGDDGVDRAAKTAAARLYRPRRPKRCRADRWTLWRAGGAAGRFSPGSRARRTHRVQGRAMDGADQRRRHRRGGLSAELTAFVAAPAHSRLSPQQGLPARGGRPPHSKANPGGQARRFR